MSPPPYASLCHPSTPYTSAAHTDWSSGPQPSVLMVLRWPLWKSHSTPPKGMATQGWEPLNQRPTIKQRHCGPQCSGYTRTALRAPHKTRHCWGTWATAWEPCLPEPLMSTEPHWARRPAWMNTSTIKHEHNEQVSKPMPGHHVCKLNSNIQNKDGCRPGPQSNLPLPSKTNTVLTTTKWKGTIATQPGTWW